MHHGFSFLASIGFASSAATVLRLDMAPQLSLGVQSRGTPEGLGILLLLLDNIPEIPGRSQVGQKVPGTLILVFTNFISFLGWLNYFSPVISRSPEQRYPSGPWQPLFTLGRVPCEISRGSQNGQNCLLYAYISVSILAHN